MQKSKQSETIFGGNIKQEGNQVLEQLQRSPEQHPFQVPLMILANQESIEEGSLDLQLNSVDNGVEIIQWTKKEKSLLFDYHYKLGNKWSIISALMPGTQKEKYVELTILKGFKLLNQYISLPQNKLKHKPIKATILSKLLIVIDDKFERKLGVSDSMINRCQIIKNSVLEISNQSNSVTQNLIETTIAELSIFNQQYRKKKKVRLFPKGTISIKKKRTKTIHRNSSDEQSHKNASQNLNSSSTANFLKYQKQDLVPKLRARRHNKVFPARVSYQERSVNRQTKIQLISSIIQQQQQQRFQCEFQNNMRSDSRCKQQMYGSMSFVAVKEESSGQKNICNKVMMENTSGNNMGQFYVNVYGVIPCQVITQGFNYPFQFSDGQNNMGLHYIL